MRTLNLAPGLNASDIVLGCMRIAGMPVNEVAGLIAAAQDSGVNFYDHADIYGGGKSEEVFGKALKTLPIMREDIYLQSKCGIKTTDGPTYFDFSIEHILTSVDKILKRLDTDYLDVLLLHRPDALVEPEEVAEAFDRLEKAGKVRHFGVSNHNPGQMELLQKTVRQKLLFNQLQFSLMFTGMVDAGLNVNMKNDHSVVHDNGILDYCRLKEVTVQAWSPYQYGFFEGVFVGNKKFPEVNKALEEMADKYGVSPSAIASAFLLRHPVSMQVVLGTTNKDRVKDIAKASDITLSRKDWYALYRSAGNDLP
ncbi:MAG: aldo/keto reductase family oxidoreductase [Clostridiales bacterium]|nr:aldo/keto reductase family oxidoreductase [Clostridiales bacterium]